MSELVTCFSGHRPEKLNEKGIFSSTETRLLKAMLLNEIKSVIGLGCRKFITGLAMGVDLWAAEIVINLKDEYELELIGVKPYIKHHAHFPADWAFSYEFVVENCNQIIIMENNYTSGCFKKRNYYMVEHSTHLIAVVKNYQSGTGQTISYANSKGLTVKIINL